MKIDTQVMPWNMTSTPHFFNLVASVIPKCRTFKLLRWVQRNPLITFEPTGLNLVRNDDTEDDLDSILFNAVVSTIPKWRTFKLLRWVQLLNRLVDIVEILYGSDGTEYCFYCKLMYGKQAYSSLQNFLLWLHFALFLIV
jgi:hypothetical protein